MQGQAILSSLHPRRLTLLLGAALLGAAAIAATPHAYAAQADLDCKLTFSMSGWSAIYKRADGHGTVTCENGESMPVNIRVRGGGLTAGKWHIDNGTGTFTDVHRISNVLGDYAQGEANVGAIKAGTAQVLTKGTVSLALAGVGQGIDLGLSGAKFTLSRAGRAHIMHHGQ
ncbi:MAG TPA: hypothetical protein VN725_03800 [Rhodanobacteraceae bacterium]|nr:hypothetical protein [Rhodanobacteraceae bacterium]